MAIGDVLRDLVIVGVRPGASCDAREHATLTLESAMQWGALVRLGSRPVLGMSVVVDLPTESAVSVLSDVPGEETGRESRDGFLYE